MPADSAAPVPTAPIRTAIAGFGLSGSVFHAPLIAANPAYSLTAALAVTFPFNITLGIPLFFEIARLTHP